MYEQSVNRPQLHPIFQRPPERHHNPRQGQEYYGSRSPLSVNPYYENSAMPVSYSQTARGQNQYFAPRHQRLSTPRLPSVGNMPVPSLSYVPGGQYPVVPPILNMMPQIPYQISQTSGARHQTHAPAPTATAGPTSGNFYAQPPPQGTIFIPQAAVSSAYYGPQLIGLPPMRNSTYPANSAPSQMPTQQAPPQQPQVVSSAGAANQQMMMGMQPGCSPHPQVLANAQQGGGQMPGQPGQLIPGQPSGAGGPPLSGLPSHKDKRKRPNAIAVVNPLTGADVIAEMLLDEASGGGISGGSAGQGRDNDHHHSQVAADFAARVAAVATENLVPVAPTVTETPPPSSGSSIPSPAPAPTVIPSPEDVINSTPITINGPQVPPCTPTPPPPVSLSVAPQIVEQQQTVAAPVIQPVISAPQPPPPSQAIPIVSAQTNSPAVDLHRPTQHVCVPPGSSPARKPSQQQSIQHAQVVQESDVKPVKTKKESRRPTPIPTSPPSISSQHHPSSGGVQIPSSAVPSAVHQQQQPSSTPAVHQVPPPQQQQQQQKEHHSSVSSNIPSKREQQTTVLPPLSSSSTHTVPTPHKSSFADSFDVKNFVVSQPIQQQQSQQQQHRQHQEHNKSTPVAASSTATSVEKETNGETDVHDTVSSNAAHPQSSHSSSHGSNSALYVNQTKVMDKKRRRKSKTRSNNNSNSSSSSRRRDSRDITNIINFEQREQLTIPPLQDLGGFSSRSNLGNKAVQRQKSKPMKKKDLNRKGGEKEGTDMDAFVGSSAPALPAVSTAQVSSGEGAATTTVSTTNSSSTTVGVTPSSSPAVVTAASQQPTSTVIQETVSPVTGSSSPTTTIVTTITSSSITTTSTVPSSSSQSQINRQPSPSVEKRTVIPTPFSKQPQDERDSSISISTSVSATASSTSSSTISTSASIPTSAQVTPVTTPMSDDSDSSSIDAMVAAKNQENTKVSALLNNNNNLNNNNINNIDISNNSTTIKDNNNAKSIDDETQNSIVSGGDSPQTSVTGTVIETMTIERSQPIQLMYNYKEGQWSPLNTEGKKVYDRDFLLEVRKNPLSTRKPDNIDPDVFRDKPHDTVLSNNNNRRNIHTSNSMSLGNRGDNAVPTFMRSSQSQRSGGMISSKGGRGSGGGGGGPRMGVGGSMSSSMRDRDRMMGKGGGSSFGGPMSPFRGEEPQLHKTANSWKPSRNQEHNNKSEEEFKTDKLLKAVRGILNKLTPQKFETLLNQILALPIDTNERLTRVVHLVFSKAVDEPSFSKEYAELCRRLSLNKMPQQQSQEQQGDQQQQQQHSASFRKLLLNKCQEEFEKNKTDELNIEARTKEIEECTDQEKKKELKLLLEEEERRCRVKKVGLVRFIGELYKLKMLTNKIMHGCITVLLDKIDEESLECLCKLLTTIGKELEQMSDKKDFDQYFQKMLKLSQKSPDAVVSSRIRFMLQDVIELRMKNWVPRRDENNPKTIEQIHKDAERETMLESALLSSQVGGGRSGGGGGGRHDSRDDRRGRQRGGGQSEDGWHSVGSGKNFSKNSYSVEPSKLQHFKDIDNSMSLGSSYQWGQWTTGAGTKKSPNPQLHVNNKFAALGRSDQDERKPMSMMNRKGVITPSPSLEKERSFSGVKEGLDRNSLSSGSTGRNAGGGSGPPSRESSRPRFGGGSSLSGAQQTNISGNQPGGSSSISNQIPAVQPAPAPSAPIMDEEESERKTKTIIDEWLDNNNIQETVQTVQDTFVGIPNLRLFLRAALNLVLDHRKVIARPKTGHLLAVLVQENTIPPQELVTEFATLIEFGDDYQVDIPHVWKYIGEILGPVIAQEVFSFADIRSTAEPVRPSKGFTSTLAEIIRILIKEKGPGWIRTQWESSKVQMKDFVPEEDLDKFIKENNLGFIIGEGEVQGVADSSLTPTMVEEKILSFLHKDNDKVLDHIGDWLNANLGEKTKENDFIKALTRAVIKASLKGDKLSSPKLLKNEKLIKKFVDNDEGRELACLYSIQNLLINEFVHPPGVLLETFQTLYENGTISRDAFLRWKEPHHDEDINKEHAGKGVALASLQSFFVSLSEQDDTDDEAPS